MTSEALQNLHFVRLYCKQVMSLKKTGRKIERNANLILYFNASFFIYKVKRASLSMIDYDSVSGFQQRKS